MDYSGVLSLTLKNWWGHKKYWLIAFIALFNPFLFSIFGIFIGTSASGLQPYSSTMVNSTTGLSVQSTTSAELSFISITTIVFIISIIIYIFYVIIVGNMLFAGMIKGYAISNETGKSLGIIETLKLGSKNWVKLIAQKLILSSPLLIVVVIFSIIITIVSFTQFSELSKSTSESAGASYSMSIMLIMCAYYVIAFVLAYFSQIGFEISARYLVIEEQGFWQSIKSGLMFIKKNLKIVFVAILLLIVMGGITYLIVLIPSTISVIFLFISMFLIPFIINTQPVLATILFFVITAIASLTYVFAMSLSITLNISFWNSFFIKFKEFKKSKELTN
ncbi:MAG: hypothetical protein WCK31_03155 [bacterium]